MSEHEQLLRFNAERCARAATYRPCRCRCGGTLHGLRHPEIWIREQIEQMNPTQQRRDLTSPRAAGPSASRSF